MAEGFLNLGKDSEGEAEKCLQDLINRCLVLVSKKSLDETKIRSCKGHDLIYDLCLIEVQRGNVFIMNDIVFEESDAIKARRPNHVPSECQSLSRHKMQPFKRWTGREINYFPFGLYRALLTPGHHQLTDDDNNNLLKRTRSIFFSGRYSSTFILKSELIHFKLLKVLDLSRIKIDLFPLHVLSLIWLRYLALPCPSNFDIPPEICRLWNLQTFIVKGFTPSFITFPDKIVGLMQLRHLELDRVILPNHPSVSVDKGRRMGFSNIQTISYLSLRCCTKEVISGIQNIKKIRFYGDHDNRKRFQESKLFNNLVHLHQLETLSLRFYSIRRSVISSVTIPIAKDFPATLKKLKSEGTNLSWLYLDIIAELPNLEVLKLMFCACCGKEWYPIVRGFTRLKLLLIVAKNDNFPVLERLMLCNSDYLKEIPIEFADIHSLQLIELRWCNRELEASVARIQQEQEDLRNKPVDVRIIKPSR